jgi:outer membrane lipoprotein SlyB
MKKFLKKVRKIVRRFGDQIRPFAEVIESMTSIAGAIRVAVVVWMATTASCGTTADPAIDLAGQQDQVLPVSQATIGQEWQVEMGVVESARYVLIQAVPPARNGAVGAAVGGIAGAAIGSEIGKGRGRKVATVVGGILGASVGHSMTAAPQEEKAVEVVVTLRSNKTIVVTQGPDVMFKPGQVVKVVRSGGKTRVIN